MDSNHQQYRGASVKIPAILNTIYMILSTFFTVIYILILTRLMPLIYFTIYSVIVSVSSITIFILSTLSIWVARDYAREGDRVFSEYSILYYSQIIITVVIVLIVALMSRFRYIDFSVLMVSIFMYIFGMYFLVNINRCLFIVSPSYSNIALLMHNLLRLVIIIYLVYVINLKDIAYIFMAEGSAGLSASIPAYFLMPTKGGFLKIFIPRKFSLDKVRKWIYMSISSIINTIRNRETNIYIATVYYITFNIFYTNSLAVSYYLLNRLRRIFRSIQSGLYTKVFYSAAGARDFEEFIRFVMMLSIYTSIFLIATPHTLMTVFNPRYLEYAYVIPIIGFLIILSGVRITLENIVLGMERIDSYQLVSLKDVLKSRYMTVTSLQFYIFLLTLSIALLTLYISTYSNLWSIILYIPPLYMVIEEVVNIILLNRVVYDFLRYSIPWRDISIFILSAALSIIYLIYSGADHLVIKDIQLDILPYLVKSIFATLIYIAVSLSSSWVRKQYLNIFKIISSKVV